MPSVTDSSVLTGEDPVPFTDITEIEIEIDSNSVVRFHTRNVDNFTLYPNDLLGKIYTFKLATQGAKFSQAPLMWESYPGMKFLGSHPPFTLDLDRTMISFMVPPPHIFLPWIFRLRVDFSGVNGILSQDFYIGKQLCKPILTLQYDAGNGDFSLLTQEDGNPSIDLFNELFLFHLFPGTCTVDLRTINGGNDQAIFSAEFIKWTRSTPPPDWIVTQRTSDRQCTITVNANGRGKAEGFRFSIDFGGVSGILSPDPIIVNATIGDGTGG